MPPYVPENLVAITARVIEESGRKIRISPTIFQNWHCRLVISTLDLFFSLMSNVTCYFFFFLLSRTREDVKCIKRKDGKKGNAFSISREENLPACYQSGERIRRIYVTCNIVTRDKIAWKSHVAAVGILRFYKTCNYNSCKKN